MPHANKHTTERMLIKAWVNNFWVSSVSNIVVDAGDRPGGKNKVPVFVETEIETHH